MSDQEVKAFALGFRDAHIAEWEHGLVQLADRYISLLTRNEKLETIAHAAASLMSEDDAVEALSHYNCLFILREALAALDEEKK